MFSPLRSLARTEGYDDLGQQLEVRGKHGQISDMPIALRQGARQRGSVRLGSPATQDYLIHVKAVEYPGGLTPPTPPSKKLWLCVIVRNFEINSLIFREPFQGGMALCVSCQNLIGLIQVFLILHANVCAIAAGTSGLS